MAFAMTKQLAERPVDPGLEALLKIERRLRARVEQARSQARDRLDAALAEAQATREREAARFEEEARARADQDGQRERERRSTLLAEHAAALRRLADVPAERIDALARAALARAIDPERKGPR